MGRYVVDASVVLHWLETGAELPANHQLLAPTLMRSEILDSLYQSVRRGELPKAEGRDRLARFGGMKIRYLGDKVLRRRAWDIASQLEWPSTRKAEYAALTQLQADAFVTLDTDLADEVDGIVVTAALADLD